MTDNYKRTPIAQNPNSSGITWIPNVQGNTVHFTPQFIPPYMVSSPPPAQTTPVGNITKSVDSYSLDINLPNVLKKRLPPIEILKNGASNKNIQFELPTGHIIYYKYKSDANSLNRPSRAYFKRFITTSSWVFDISQISLVDSFIDEIAKEFKFKVKPLIVQVDPAAFSGVDLIIIPPYHYLADKFKNSISTPPNKNMVIP